MQGQGFLETDRVGAYQAVWRAAQALPALILENTGRLIWAGPEFLELARLGEPFRIYNGYLTFNDRAIQASFLAFLTSASVNPSAWSIEHADGSHLLFRSELVEPVDMSSAVACRIFDSRARGKAVWGDIERVFGLTPTEAIVARRLVEGELLTVLSEDLNITFETAKTHLRRIYAKVGAGSREELYAKLMPFRVA